MKYILKLPAIFSDSIPLADVIETMARTAAGGGDGSEPVHRKSLLNTRLRYARSVLQDVKDGAVTVIDGEGQRVAADTVSDARLYFATRGTLNKWAALRGDAFEFQFIPNNPISIDNDGIGYIWGGCNMQGETSSPENGEQSTANLEAAKPIIATDASKSDLAAAKRAALDMKRQRGVKREILEQWLNIVKLYGIAPNARQIQQVVDRVRHKSERIPQLKTIRNQFKALKNDGLIPG